MIDGRTLQNVYDIGDMPGESRQRLLNRLLVTDVGENLFEQAKLRLWMSRNMQPGLRHQHQQPHRFQADGFSSGVGTCDYHGTRFGGKLNLNGDDQLGIKQWMSGLKEAYPHSRLSRLLILFDGI